MNQKNNSRNLLKNYQSNFSHIYVEREILNHKNTIEILNKFPNSKIIEIENYKDVFNRVRQNFNEQKKSQKLILAEKKFDFVYTGSEFCENFGESNFYYSSNILNCFYDCEYCYLKGLYQSSNVVIFVNIEDFFNEVKKVSNNKKIYLCISYDSDLLAFENITGFVSKWIDFAIENPNVLIEIRTKSNNFKSIAYKHIPKNIIFAWTLSPQKIIEMYEHRTPSINARLEDIKLAISEGIKIRISIEPIMKIKEFENVYSDFVQNIFMVIPNDSIRDVNLGVFRMSTDHIKRIHKLNEFSNIFAYSLERTKGGVSYKDSKYMRDFVYNEVIKFIDKSKVY
ncbi:radical SAM protein [Haloimpatiens sp. FM7330]|uniref:SPL family radical SAM protein n=1 Tax=Haloimpatiens sp. FM7330 TaxID=3298610 RepID=UPI00362B07F2